MVESKMDTKATGKCSLDINSHLHSKITVNEIQVVGSYCISPWYFLKERTVRYSVFTSGRNNRGLIEQ